MNTDPHQNDFEQEFNENEGINLRDILLKYLYFWPVFVLCLLITLSLAFVYLRYTKPTYEVKATLLIKDNKKGSDSKDILNQLDLFGGSKVVENEIEILQSKALMSKVVDRLNLAVKYNVEGRVVNSDIYEERPVNMVLLDIDPSIYGKIFQLKIIDDSRYELIDMNTGHRTTGAFDVVQRSALGVYKLEKTAHFFSNRNKILTLIISDPVAVTDSYLSNLKVGIASKQSTVLELVYIATIPKRGKDILNTLIKVYNEAALADKNQTTQSTISFINERLALISGELTDVEKQAEIYKSSQGLTNITDDAALFLDNVKANDLQLNVVNIKLEVIKDIKRYINSNSTQEKLPGAFGIEDPVLISQLNQLSEAQLQRDRLLATTQPQNPILEPVNKQIATIRASMKTNIENIEASLLSTKRGLQSYSAVYENSIKKIPQQERQFTSIKRQQGIKESLYLYLLQKQEEAALSYASSIADSRVVDAAYSSKQPIQPKRENTFLIALLLGIALPILYIYIKELINNKILRTSDITKLTNIPVLGEIGYEESSDPIVVNVNSRKAVAEQFRAIRTNLQYMHGKNTKGRVTLFTSSMSGEGKSFVASNIGTALAISGKKTVLLELDLRKPKISKYLNLTNRSGLSNYLIGKSEIKDIIQPSGIHENLFVVGSGPIPPNPSELLVQDDMDTLIAYLKTQFDEILIDTPPIGLVTDAQILARLADVSIYLVRQSVTLKDQIKRMDLIARDKFPRLNIVFNGIKDNGQNGYYGYGYGYGYDYYSDSKPSRFTFKSAFKNFLKRF